MQPLASVPVTVYVTVVVGDALMLVPVVALRPVAGDHKYVAAPVAVNVLELPVHSKPVGDMAITAVKELTVTIWVAFAVQPFVAGAVTVYVLVTVVLVTTLAPVVADRLVAGAQVYVVPPDAVKVIELPLHIAPPPLGVMEIVGTGLTLTVLDDWAVQPEVVPVAV